MSTKSDERRERKALRRLQDPPRSGVCWGDFESVDALNRATDGQRAEDDTAFVRQTLYSWRRGAWVPLWVPLEGSDELPRTAEGERDAPVTDPW